MPLVTKPYHLKDIYKPGMSFHIFMEEIFKTDYSDDRIYGKLFDSLSTFGKDHVSFFMFPEVGMGGHWKNKPRDWSPIFQFWFEEYIDGLAKYILANVGYSLVLEVGAGDGQLTKLLKAKGINILATDDYSWKIRKTNVEKLDHKQAIDKYKPAMVISSWMPYHRDWTRYFRKSQSVEHYILIGEAYGGCCASDPSFYNHKGWTKTEDFDFDRFNLCRSDDVTNPKTKSFFHNLTHSRTIAYKKNDN